MLLVSKLARASTMLSAGRMVGYSRRTGDMEKQSLNCHGRERCAVEPLSFLLLALLCGAMGCSHSGDVDMREPGFVRVFAPQFPDFLRAPMGLLLTNGPGYSAQLESQNTSLPMAERTTSGQL